MAASQRQACSDPAEDKSGRFIAPQRRRLHYRPTRVVNLRSTAIGSQTAKWRAINPRRPSHLITRRRREVSRQP